MKQNAEKQRPKPRIRDWIIYIHPELKKAIQEKFHVSHTTVRAALMRYNNSQTAQEIRRYALELMKKEMRKLEKTL